jgi:prepilin-type N-terminal cleavage/methylation domain-containing protein
VKRRRPGFSLVELMLAMVIAAILVRIAVPAYTAWITRARAAAAVSDLMAVRTAALTHFTATSEWPPDESRGVVPGALADDLSGVDFQRAGYLLDWQNWSSFVGVSVTTSDRQLGAAVLDLLGAGHARYHVGEHYTMVIELKN